MPQSQEERWRRVRLLLASRNDYLPGPPTSTGRLQLAAGNSGPAPSKNVPCDDCLRSGRVHFTYEGETRERACPVCDGRGWRKRRKGEEAWDEYLRQPVREAVQEAPKRPFRLDEDYRRISAELDRMEPEKGSYAWERTHALMDRHGSYRELERALTQLATFLPSFRAAVRRVYEMPGVPVVHSDGDVALVEASVRYLASRMRGEIRIPAWLEAPEKEKKKVGIRELAALGWTAGRIARVLALPKKKVQRLLKEAA